MKSPCAEHLIAFALALITSSAFASSSDLFESYEVIDVRITGAFDSLIRKTEQRKELPFVLNVDGADHDVNIRVRGKSRARICDFPPLRLNFKTKDTAGTLFEGQDKLKLVTHCMNHDRGEVDMLQEYIAYRAFNAITDISYRVRLLNINYVDVDGKLGKKAANRHGLLLEPATAFAVRVGAERLRTKTIRRGALDLDQSALVFVFEYLVANTDWALVSADGDEDCCHNIDVYKAETGEILVPYDLDLAGVVNARYAYPDRSLRIHRVTQRLYRGMCMQRDVLQAALRHVKSRRAKILAIPASVPDLSQKDRQDTRDYLAKFFAVAEDEDKLLDSFENHCIKPRYRRVE